MFRVGASCSNEPEDDLDMPRNVLVSAAPWSFPQGTLQRANHKDISFRVTFASEAWRLLRGYCSANSHGAQLVLTAKYHEQKLSAHEKPEQDLPELDEMAGTLRMDCGNKFDLSTVLARSVQSLLVPFCVFRSRWTRSSRAVLRRKEPTARRQRVQEPRWRLKWPIYQH